MTPATPWLCLQAAGKTVCRNWKNVVVRAGKAALKQAHDQPKD